MNLYENIMKFKKKQKDVPRLVFKVLAYQIFRSLLYLEHKSIAHRDIKPQNILLNEKDWKLVICDFGSAKKLQTGQPNIAYICSRCYRAPELIFGNQNYTTQIDMWSVGCVLAEMVLFEPIFRAESNIDQLVEIIRILGTPTEKEVLQMNPEGDFKKYHLPKISARSWNKVFF